MSDRSRTGGEDWSALEIYYQEPSPLLLRYMRRGLELEESVADLKQRLKDR